MYFIVVGIEKLKKRMMIEKGYDTYSVKKRKHKGADVFYIYRVGSEKMNIMKMDENDVRVLL